MNKLLGVIGDAKVGDFVKITNLVDEDLNLSFAEGSILIFEKFTINDYQLELSLRSFDIKNPLSIVEQKNSNKKFQEEVFTVHIFEEDKSRYFNLEKASFTEIAKYYNNQVNAIKNFKKSAINAIDEVLNKYEGLCEKHSNFNSEEHYMADKFEKIVNSKNKQEIEEILKTIIKK